MDVIVDNTYLLKVKRTTFIAQNTILLKITVFVKQSFLENG